MNSLVFGPSVLYRLDEIPVEKLVLFGPKSGGVPFLKMAVCRLGKLHFFRGNFIWV